MGKLLASKVSVEAVFKTWHQLEEGEVSCTLVCRIPRRSKIGSP